MKILLVQPPWSSSFGHFKTVARLALLYPPLGLCYLASVAERLGHTVSIIDGEPDCMTIGSIRDQARRTRPDLVGITTTTPLLFNAVSLAREIKAVSPETIVLLGGPHVSAEKERVLEENACFDYAIFGEGETSFGNFLRSLADAGDMARVKGLIRRERNQVIVNACQELIQDLDSIPFPNRSLLNTDSYVWSVPGKGMVKIHSITTTRGCPFKCVFCSQHVTFGRVVRERSVDNIFEEILAIKRDMDIHHLYFTDDTFTLNRKRALKLADRLIKEKLGITFEASTRANCVDYELLKKLREAGMNRISMGIETGDADILKRIKKGVVHSEMLESFGNAKKLGFETKGSVMLGHPGETPAQIEKTIAFLKRFKALDQISFSIAIPYPGTELMQMVKNHDYGMDFEDVDFSEYKRYGGKPVIKHPQVSAEELLNFQRKGLISFYFSPKRVVYNLGRAGIQAAFMNSIGFFRSLFLKK